MLYPTEFHRPSLLDVPVSIFANAQANAPESAITLRQAVCSTEYKAQIEAIRAEPDENKQKEMKKHLPAITPVARLCHRRAETTFADKIAQQWPLLYIDIDQADNPHVDMQELKQHVCRWPYVLVCADSVRNGFWCVIPLPDGQTPDTLAAHFRYVKKLFDEHFGVILDKSKGGNPCHLRYLSYDPAPFLNEQAMTMYRTYTKAVTQTGYINTSMPSTRQEYLLSEVVTIVRNATDGERHHKLLKAATLAGGFIAAGRMDEQTVVYYLEMVASEWPNLEKSKRTIRDGIRYGQKKPITN